MRAFSLPLKEAYEFVKFRRPEILPNPYCMLQLIKAERQLFRSQSVNFADVGKMGGLKRNEYLAKTPSTCSLLSSGSGSSQGLPENWKDSIEGSTSNDGTNSSSSVKSVDGEVVSGLEALLADDLSPPTNIFCMVTDNGCSLM
jgi:hypothetical protein